MRDGRGNRVFSLFFLVSLGLHGFLMGMPESFFTPSYEHMSEREEIIVEINIENPAVLPRIDAIGEEKRIKKIEEKPELRLREEPEEETVEAMPEKKAKEEAPEEEPVEASDPGDEMMLRYQDMIRQRIQACSKYPAWAKRQEMEGAVYICFTLLSNGSVRGVEVVRSSGYDILDKEAVAAVAGAAPFSPIPDKFKASCLSMEVEIMFKFPR